MRSREEVCWFIGGIFGLVSILIGGVGTVEVKIAQIKADAKVKITQEIGRSVVDSIDGIGEWWQD